MATATTTPPAVRPLEGEQRVLLRGVGWDGYETLLRLAGDGHVRITYDRGDAELMSPSRDHDTYARLIGRLIDTVTEELEIACEGLRSTTWRRQARERGLEADDCFYLASLPRVRGRRGPLDLENDPPPDLAVEVEISRGSLDKLAVYAALRVPEVWRFDGQHLTVHVLQPEGTYAVAAASPSLPAVTPEEVASWVREGEAVSDRTPWARRLRAWVRDEVRPRVEGRE